MQMRRYIAGSAQAAAVHSEFTPIDALSPGELSSRSS